MVVSLRIERMRFEYTITSNCKMAGSSNQF